MAAGAAETSHWTLAQDREQQKTFGITDFTVGN